MIESTGLLTSAQAAARLGIKPETLYAYVSRGLLERHRSPDGRTSLFEPDEVARLEGRRAAKRTAPADITVPSDLTLVDKDDGRLWFRGLDAFEACRRYDLEDIAAWLWTGAFDLVPAWDPDTASLAAAKRAQAALPSDAPPAQRIAIICSTLAALHGDDREARSAERATSRDAHALPVAADIMGCLVEALPGMGSASTRYADHVATKLGASTQRSELVDVLASAMTLVCEHGLTHPTLAARLTASAGGGIASAVASAMNAASAAVAPLAAIERAFTVAATDGVMRAADQLDARAIAAASWKEPYRAGDPRAAAIIAMVRSVAASFADTATSLSDELQHRGAPPPTAGFALATVAFACGMPPGSASAISLIARTVGWIAHAIEEHDRPTPYRPRLAYTGRPPRTAAPKRPLDAVQGYLSR